MAKISRRRFVAMGALAVASEVSGRTASSKGGAPAIRAGDRARAKPRSALAEAFDSEMETFMTARGIPGGALAVVRNHRLAYSRGYGLANREQAIQAAPSTLFRIASLSKPITALALMKLVEEGQVELDRPALEILRPEVLAETRQKSATDPRLHRVTIRHLLHHTGGWDRSQSFDPMFQSSRIASALGAPRPASAEAVIRFMETQPLDFDPGARYAYSNFGYCLLGRIIEKMSGQPYERFVKDRMLTPLGIQKMRLGATLLTRAAPGESRYYEAEGHLVESVFPDSAEKVPRPYGGFCLESMDAHGGWIASVEDLAKFAAAFSVPQRWRLLKPPSLRILDEPPPPPAWRRPDGRLEAAYYGLGWMVRPVGRDGKANYWHAGSLPGTSSLLVRRWDGLSWAVLFNKRSDDPLHPDNAIDRALHRAADAVTEWPIGKVL